jgi:hypothetical protein
MARRRRDADPFTMSFLDIMCCGFGAIILWMMISRSSPNVSPAKALEVSEHPTSGSILDRQKQLFALEGETNVFNRELTAKQQQLSEHKERIARLRAEISEINGKFNATAAQSSNYEVQRGKLALARQSLTDEMKKLQANRGEQMNTQSVGGVPVDSEYIIFIIDTSGSMFDNAWNRVQDAISQTLKIYPIVKGIQVLDADGEYMFSSYADSWIPDGPAQRSAITQRLRNWRTNSNSTPVDGITKAIRTFNDPDKKISLYVFGDDFTGDSIREVVETVDRINVSAVTGKRIVRIHGIGFPTWLSQAPRYQSSSYRFSALMRELARKNGGTFVGLDDFY